MLSVLHEFSIHPSAFHHALEAWEVPELLKSLEKYVPLFDQFRLLTDIRNITIATFAENGLFKAEAQGPIYGALKSWLIMVSKLH